MLTICGCSEGKNYSLSDVEKTLSDTFGYECNVIEIECPTDNSWGIDDCHIVQVYSNDDNNTPYDYLDVYVFDIQKDAKAFFNKLVNEEYDGIYVNDSGKNFCHFDDFYNFCDAYGENYIYIKDNVIFKCEEMNGSKGKRREAYLDFCHNTLPELADALG